MAGMLTMRHAEGVCPGRGRPKGRAQDEARWGVHAQEAAPTRGGPCADRYFFGGTGLPPGRTVGGGKRSLRICSARMAA
ncbi:hypothetical protein Nocox_14525 [Nonomuraea coxensis DSM 45129]|uniref:Uncharacterized protein n=1 Tax=Nonomuraea coxensis DSM 45129 TaxID=1122611 RepID=A0ABX8TYV3_9ACTN|nr:hypothetical protein Nocox_14525 [Nonomuraea coxensis DSM 45129]